MSTGSSDHDAMNTTTPDIMDTLTAGMAHAAANPEAIEVLVVTESEDMARLAGPMLARILHPGRRFGEVLHAEPAESGWAVAVRDLGIVTHTTKGGIPAPTTR